jgi:fatty acid desaturase
VTERTWKDYSLSGGSAGAITLTNDALEGRVEAEWQLCRVDRKALKALMRRSDWQGVIHFALWFALLAATGTAAFFAWGTLWAIPAFAAYGVLYASSSHASHELTHGTPFKTRWLNDAVYHVCTFMAVREAFYWRWSHARHHTHTIVVGRDPEIQVPRPPSILDAALDLFFIRAGSREIVRIFRHATGRITPDGRHFVPESEFSKVVWSSRVYVGIYVTIAATCWAAGSILPALYLVLPRFYGGPLSQLFNMTQHAGLEEDVHDHRLNTRTVYMNPIFCFLYRNMNYHIEHHMFPLVPFHALPKAHELIKHQCPPAYPSLVAAYREIMPALLRQRRDPSWCVQRERPSAARLATAAE